MSVNTHSVVYQTMSDCTTAKLLQGIDTRLPLSASQKAGNQQSDCVSVLLVAVAVKAENLGMRIMPAKILACSSHRHGYDLSLLQLMQQESN